MDKTLESIMGTPIGSVIQSAFESTSIEMLGVILMVGIIALALVGTNFIFPRRW